MPYYVLHIHTARCACGAEQTWSHIYQCEAHGAATKMSDATFIPPQSPVDTHRIRHKDVPLCASCITPTHATRGAGERQAWEETKRRKAREAATPANVGTYAAQPKRKVFNIKDFA